MPGGRLPLRIFEPRYLAMVRDCFKNQSGFGICIAKDDVAPSTTEPYSCGTLIEITDWDQDENGLLLIVTEGVQKFRIISTRVTQDDLLTGEVELLPLEKKTPVPANLVHLAELLKRALHQVGPLVNYTEGDFEDAVWVSGRLVELMPMSARLRQDLCELDDPVERLIALEKFIGTEQ